MCVWNTSKWRMLLQLFQNSLISLGQMEWIIINLKISWVIWNPTMATLSIKWKFVGSVLARYLNACVLKSETELFLEMKGYYYLSFVIMIGTCDCVLHSHHLTHEWNEHKPTRSESPHQWNVQEEALIVGTANVIGQYDILLNYEEGKVHWC
jgi:hypothetical protein